MATPCRDAGRGARAGSTRWSTSPASPGRPASPKGTEDDWRAVLTVHLDGYLNVLAAALPIMAAAGHGRILGVTSGSGWRQADAGAYSCAKRAVAALTWQLGRQAPPGVVVNAMSPIAVTRMVTAALGRAQPKAGSKATGGLSLGSMPTPEELGPFGAYLVGDGLRLVQRAGALRRRSEVAVVDEPRLLEVVRTDDVASVAHVLEVGPASVGAGRGRPGEQRREQPAVRRDLRRSRSTATAAGGGALVLHRRRPIRPVAAALTRRPRGARRDLHHRSRSAATSASAMPPVHWPRRWSRPARWTRSSSPSTARSARPVGRLGAGARRARRHRRRASTPTLGGPGRWRTTPSLPTVRFGW